MLNNEGALANTHYSALSQHVAAVRHAMGVIQGPGRLPAHLLFSDRDFNENDYEALLALDDNVVSRKGEAGAWTSHPPPRLSHQPEEACRTRWRVLIHLMP